MGAKAYILKDLRNNALNILFKEGVVPEHQFLAELKERFTLTTGTYDLKVFDGPDMGWRQISLESIQ